MDMASIKNVKIVKRQKRKELINKSMPKWFWEFLRLNTMREGETFHISTQKFIQRKGIPRLIRILSNKQKQTGDSFGFKWKKRDTFESPESLKRTRDWLIERYGDVVNSLWFKEHGSSPLLVDAGCGAGLSSIELFGRALLRVRYLGIDISEAVDIAKKRFDERNISAGFMQADISKLPFPRQSVDLIFAEGVLHHTQSTKATLISLSKLLKPGGRFLIYVYRKKGPIREFADDFIRKKIQGMSPEKAWSAIEPLTHLGIELGKLNVIIDIPKEIDLLEIPSGCINVQRLFYWHFAKAFYRPDFTFEEMNHINYDWYAPVYAHRQTPEEMRLWCKEAQLEIEREIIEESGITIIARKDNVIKK